MSWSSSDVLLGSWGVLFTDKLTAALGFVIAGAAPLGPLKFKTGLEALDTGFPCVDLVLFALCLAMTEGFDGSFLWVPRDGTIGGAAETFAGCRWTAFVPDEGGPCMKGHRSPFRQLPLRK